MDAAIGSSPAILAEVGRETVNLAVWERQIADGLSLSLSAVPLGEIADIRFETSAAALPRRLRRAMALAGYPASLSASVLRRDITGLARRFARQMTCARLTLRLDVVTTNSCHRFHGDYVTARLITTYLGPGTQWLDRDDATALAAGTPIERLTVRQLPTGAVALFKGRRWAPEQPIIHRSPPIGGTGALRLVLTIDADFDRD